MSFRLLEDGFRYFVSCREDFAGWLSMDYGLRVSCGRMDLFLLPHATFHQSLIDILKRIS